ncbi:MAG: membrane integrity-associated transporter subunit PqiC [Acetobacteraceae bacterium]|nr:membrane integrity-associated transporter subunit PqiC [Acetobacteraceae bacterium]
MKRWAPVLLFVGLAACRSPPTHFYLLDATPSSQRWTASGKPIEINHIVIPAVLDRNSLVVRSGPNELKVSDADRWAAPLDDMTQRVLAADLRDRLPPSLILQPGDPTPSSGARQLTVVIRQFMGDTAGVVRLNADWSLVAGQPSQPVQRRSEAITVQARSAEAPDLVAAMSQAVGQLADRIGAAVGATASHRR